MLLASTSGVWTGELIYFSFGCILRRKKDNNCTESRLNVSLNNNNESSFNAIKLISDLTDPANKQEISQRNERQPLKDIGNNNSDDKSKYYFLYDMFMTLS